MKSAYLAGGCFWCIEAPLSMAQGVLDVTAGFSGGVEPHPTYQQVKSQATSHRETIKVDYDPEQVSYEGLLKVFLSHIDPLDDQGQFGDKGRSYTTAIYYETAGERDVAHRLLAELAQMLGETPKVALERLIAFWPAEEEHLHYYLVHPEEWAEEMRNSGRGALHKMQLDPTPYSAIKEGRKQVEIRLNDPKRQLIASRDNILFVNRVTGESMTYKVIAKRTFPDFAALYRAYPAAQLGYLPDQDPDPDDMLRYYTPEDVARYGTCALELVPLDRFAH